MLMEKVPMTAPGLKTLEDELKQLKSVERPSIIKAIAAAMPNFDNLQASTRAGVSQVRINTPP